MDDLIMISANGTVDDTAFEIYLKLFPSGNPYLGTINGEVVEMKHDLSLCHRHEVDDFVKSYIEWVTVYGNYRGQALWLILRLNEDLSVESGEIEWLGHKEHI